MARPVRHEVEEQILDRAAGLFAQHGFEHTSLKDLADAAGLSKAGLLHHYPSKEALYHAAAAMGRTQSAELIDRISRVPAGRSREKWAVELFTDYALDRPGLVALVFRTVPALATDGDLSEVQDAGALLFDVFNVDPTDGDAERLVRVVGMGSALAVLSLAANRAGEQTAWRPHIVAACLDILGHRGPSPTASDSVQVEA